MASRIALELSDLTKLKVTPAKTSALNRRPVIIGGTVFDLTAKINTGISRNHKRNDDVTLMYTSNPGTIVESMGGVARNVAEACHRVGRNPLFISAVGDDMPGKSILQSLQEIGMDTNGISVAKGNTAVYNAVIHEDGELITAVADMRIHDSIDISEVHSAN